MTHYSTFSTVINGVKLVVLSGGSHHTRSKNIRFFIGGVLLNVASLFTVYASFTYNSAIATSDTDLITNAVIILFIADIDELVDGIVIVINPNWASEKKHDNEEGDEEQDEENQGKDGNQSRNSELEGQVGVPEEKQAEDDRLAFLMSENLELKKQMTKMSADNSNLKAQMKDLINTVTRMQFEMTVSE